MSNDSSPIPGNKVEEGAANVMKMRVGIWRNDANDTSYHFDVRLMDDLRSFRFAKKTPSGQIVSEAMGGSAHVTRQHAEPFAQSLAEKLFQIPGVRKDDLVIGAGLVRVRTLPDFDEVDTQTAILDIIATSFDPPFEELALTVLNDPR